MVTSKESTVDRILRIIEADAGLLQFAIENGDSEELQRQRIGAHLLARMALGEQAPHHLLTLFASGVRMGAVCGITLSMLERVEFECRQEPEESGKEG